MNGATSPLLGRFNPSNLPHISSYPYTQDFPLIFEIIRYGIRPTTDTGNPNVDSIVWVKPGGESDGECGMAGAPAAGEWFNEYTMSLVANAQPAIEPVWPPSTLPEE